MRKRILWAAITLCLSVLTLLALFHNGDLSPAELWQDLREASLRWLLAAASCMLGFIFFEGRSLVLILRTLGYPARKRRGFLYAAADIYFSSITPSATGGQPASAYFMHKDGIAGSAVMVSLILNLTMYTLAIVTLGLLSFILFPDVFMAFNAACKLMIMAGVMVMLLLAVLFIVLLKKQSFLLHACDIIVSLLARLRFRSAARRLRKKLYGAIERYNECAEAVAGRKRLLVKTYLLNLLQRTAHILVTVCCYYAMHGRHADGPRLFAIQTYVVLGSNFIPVPGAVGISEYIMYFGYLMLLDGESSYTLALLSRGMTFYTCCAISILTVLLGYAQLKLTEKKGGVIK